MMDLDTAHLVSLFEHATEGIILTNNKGAITLINPAAERMFKYDAREVIGKPIEMLIPQRFHSLHSGQRREFYGHPQNRVMGSGRDLYGRRSDGSEIPVEVSLSFYKREEDLFVTAFIVDITHRKSIEQNMLQQQVELERMTNDMRKLNTQLEVKVEERTLILKEALQKLEQSQKELHDALNKEKQLSEIKSRFVSIASHEFRTPLSTVLSSAALVSKYTTTAEQDKRDRHVEKIKNAVRNLNDILDDFLSLGKLEEGKIETHPVAFNIEEFMEEVLEEIKPQEKPGQQIVFSCEENPVIFSDKRLLKNIIINLLANAIKFSGENTSIDIRSKTRPSHFEISITDQGIGISEEDQEQLFSSFFRGRNAVNIQGTGLGLHIIKRYADLLKGTIQIKSALGRGTTVTVTIPAAHQKQ
ncbi:PAS domain-containing sensor histidine kinase [Agriterribacter sp.]|uniref:PAS domain-containing sensor histidine kinase n=1 Tax=Agriterribacter sp. TaxID=2821509 RepID=UPI002B5E76F4|nr:PAS domain-containing sensor histidine kinase [Agriterribacter sp.]HRO46289.1 PAS domain-containing sensor histidine kinase [Agriterribacter sp.]HRQ18530.1 PAS domain-containing sensor histidine kinase [Agriterribacter sp.]